MKHTLHQLWRYLVAGLLIWIPLIITFWVSWFFINKFVLGIERQIYYLVQFLQDVGVENPQFALLTRLRYVYGLGVCFVIALFVTTGVFASNVIGKRIIAMGENVFKHRIPLVSRVYTAVVQIRDVFTGRKGGVFQAVCLVEYPREGMLAVAFITSQEQGLVQQMAGKELIAVFVPTTPNPTSGYLIYLPPSEVMMLGIGVEEAMKLIISAGAYIPPAEAGSKAPSENSDAGAAPSNQRKAAN